MQAHTHSHALTCVHTHSRALALIYEHTHAHTFTHARTRTTYKYTHACAHTHAHTHTHTRTRTHTHTHTHRSLRCSARRSAQLTSPLPAPLLVFPWRSLTSAGVLVLLGVDIGVNLHAHTLISLHYFSPRACACQGVSLFASFSCPYPGYH
jgi:hypothetical protein